MAVLYDVFQSRLKTKAGKNLFYLRAVRTGNVGTNQIAREVADYSSLSPGDVKNTIDNLITVMTMHLQASESVTLDGFGTFRIAVSTRNRGAETADQVTANNVTATVKFSPAITRGANRKLNTRAFVTGMKLTRYDKLSEQTGSKPGGTGSPDTESELITSPTE